MGEGEGGRGGGGEDGGGCSLRESQSDFVFDDNFNSGLQFGGPQRMELYARVLSRFLESMDGVVGEGVDHHWEC